MTVESILILLTALFIKHFVFDFLYQPPRQWQNKGTYGHWGGIEHSLQHVLATVFILICMNFNIWTIVVVGIGEFLIHYHMDWFKMNYNAKKGWKPDTHNQFWILLGVDQLVHSLTYIGIAAVVGLGVL